MDHPFAIIDAHHHYWQLGSGRYPWLEVQREPTVLGDYSAICRDFLPADYERESRAVGVSGTVHIEAGAKADDPAAETRWLESLDTGSVPLLALVVGCDLRRPDSGQVLEQHCAASPRVRGVRLPVLGGRPLVAADPLLADGLRHLGQLDLVFEMRLAPEEMSEAASLVASNPDITFIVDHAGVPADRTPKGLADWRRSLARIARFPNTNVKLSGLVMRDHDWTNESIGRVIYPLLELFGADRIMFGSNFPVDSLFISFSNLVSVYLDAMPDEQVARKVFGENAARIYKLGREARDLAHADQLG